MNKKYFSFVEKMDVPTLFDNLIFLINYRHLAFDVTKREPFVLVEVLFRGIADKKDRLMLRLTNSSVSVVFLIEVERMITIDKKQFADSFSIDSIFVSSSGKSELAEYLIKYVIKIINDKYPSEVDKFAL